MKPVHRKRAKFMLPVLAAWSRMEMVRDFLGREPNSQAFFAEIAGKRLK